MLAKKINSFSFPIKIKGECAICHKKTMTNSIFIICDSNLHKRDVYCYNCFPYQKAPSDTVEFDCIYKLIVNNWNDKPQNILLLPFTKRNAITSKRQQRDRFLDFYDFGLNPKDIRCRRGDSFGISFLLGIDFKEIDLSENFFWNGISKKNSYYTFLKYSQFFIRRFCFENNVLQKQYFKYIQTKK